MASQYSFGGDWTELKLDLLAKYLRAYTTIFARNPKAQFYSTIYVDAFAGAGYIRAGKHGSAQEALFSELREQDAQRFILGSAARALEVEPSFKQYLFIDKDARHCEELQQLKHKYPQKRI